MKNTKLINKLMLLLGVVLITTNCSEDYLETNPTDRVSENVVFSSYQNALSFLDGTYRFMYTSNTYRRSTGRHDDFGQKSIDLAMDLMSGDLIMPYRHWFSGDHNYLYTEREDYSRTHMIWNYYYDIIWSANKIIEQIDNIDNLSETEKNTLLGQSYALRAYGYFYLIRLYQHTYIGHQSDPGVPLQMSTSIETQKKSTVAEIYKQIVTDLEAAVAALANAESREHKSHINLAVAQGIYADVALTMNNWDKAATMANAAKTNFPLMTRSSWASGFNDLSNREWMWGLEHNQETSTIYASFFSHMDHQASGYAGIGIYKTLSYSLWNGIPFTDVRKKMADADSLNGKAKNSGPLSYDKFPLAQTKFVDVGSFLSSYVLMRSAEMYLIEAEALAEQAKYTEAQNVLYDFVSSRDPSYVKSTSTGQILVNEILLQRRIELFGEGRVWLDYKRRKLPLIRLSAGSTKLEHSSWARVYSLAVEDNHFIYPIPELELDLNDNVDPNK